MADNVGNIKENIQNRVPSIHICISDCIRGLEKVHIEKPSSLFDVEPFDFLKKLHDELGAAFTLYLFWENKHALPTTQPFDLSMMDSRYKPEFGENSNWLKLGIEALNYQTPTTSQTVVDFHRTAQEIYESITNFAGQQSLPKSWKPHYYAAGLDVGKIMGKFEIETVFSAEDNRKIVAWLPPRVVKELMSGGHYIDPQTGLVFVHESFKIEDSNKSVDEMKRIIDRDISEYRISAIYTHEVEIMSVGKRQAEVQNRIRQLLEHAKSKSLEFVV